MALEHDFFGIIPEDPSGGLRWRESIDVGDQPVKVELSIDDPAGVSEIVLELAAAMARVLDGFDDRARDALIAQLSERKSATTQYVDQQVDDMGESLLDLLVHNSGDIAMDVLRSLQLVHVGLFPERSKDGEAFAVFDYSISPDVTEYLLIVSFDIQGDVVAVDVEE